MSGEGGPCARTEPWSLAGAVAAHIACLSCFPQEQGPKWRPSSCQDVVQERSLPSHTVFLPKRGPLGLREGREGKGVNCDPEITDGHQELAG